MLFPFLVHADRGVTVRQVPLSELASSVTERTALVAFSLVQSACGSLCDGPAVAAAARAVGAMTFCDITQAAGWLPVAACDYDLTVCSAYKWMCQPRGTAYLTIRPALIERLRPIHAGWYAGEDVWGSCYGPSMHLAHDARRFDVSPAWLSWVGAVPALEVMSMVPTALIGDHNIALADGLRARAGHPAAGLPVVSLPDTTGKIAARLAAAGAAVSSRAGLVRIAFHIWNTPQDVDLVASALSSAQTRA
jgi:selenocysteine lyase/cysteine desulfurase